MAQELQEADCEEGMMAVLDAVGASMEVKESFRREKVYPATVEHLTDEELRGLGVETIGERARLRSRCKATAESEIVGLTKKLLKAIVTGDSKTYDNLCADDMTFLEPETCGQNVPGKDFHFFFLRNLFRDGGALGSREVRQEILNPSVRFLGRDAAVIVYIRMYQAIMKDGKVVLHSTPETRVWQRSSGQWKLVHAHRSLPINPPGRS